MTKAIHRCSIEGCNNKHWGNGYCIKHNARFKRNGDPNIKYKEEEKTCLYCGKVFISKRKYKAIFCSKKCRDKYHYQKRIIIYKDLVCEYCGKIFDVKTVAKIPPRFCSNKCKGKYSVRKRTTIIKCNICEREFKTANTFEPVCPECAYKKRIKRTIKRNFFRKGLRRGALGPTHTEYDWQKLLNKYNGLCAYCGKRKATQRDHIIPISKGGTDSIGNILPVCGVCNAKKATRLLSEMRYKFNEVVLNV